MIMSMSRLFTHLRRLGKVILLAQLLLFLAILQPNNAVERACVTNNIERKDGFGAQFQQVMAVFAWSRYKDMSFCFTPLRTLAELNLTSTIALNASAHNKMMGMVSDPEMFSDTTCSKCQILDFHVIFEIENIHAYKVYTLETRRELRQRFDSFPDNTKPCAWFQPDRTNVVVHIRRGFDALNSKSERFAPVWKYERVMDFFRSQAVSKKVLFHVVTIEGSDDFSSLTSRGDVIMQYNTNVTQLETFHAMVVADHLVTSKSSFSYTAAILNRGVVYYFPFWHGAMQSWIGVYQVSEVKDSLDTHTSLLVDQEYGHSVHRGKIFSKWDGLLYRSSEDCKDDGGEVVITSQCFIMEGGKKRWFTDYDAFLQHGFKDADFDRVIDLPCRAMRSLPTGDPIK